MDAPVVETTFDCVDRDGRPFPLHVRIGDRHDIRTESGDTDVGFYVELDPLMKRRVQAGHDTFTAMCFCIQMVRVALKTFVAHGGSVYFAKTRSPIDLDDFLFGPIFGLLRDEFLNPQPDSTAEGG